jgi:hypothetical protein
LLDGGCGGSTTSRRRASTEQNPDVAGAIAAKRAAAGRDDSLPSTGIRIAVSDPAGKVILSKMAADAGRFAFTSQVGGDHRICLVTNTTHWFAPNQKLKFHLKLDVGDSAIDYAAVAKKEHLTALEVSVRKLNDRVKMLIAEQDYQHQREMEFRDLSESTNARVLWWSLAQTTLLLVSGIWQIRHLKDFFVQKKIV